MKWCWHLEIHAQVLQKSWRRHRPGGVSIERALEAISFPFAPCWRTKPKAPKGRAVKMSRVEVFLPTF